MNYKDCTSRTLKRLNEIRLGKRGRRILPRIHNGSKWIGACLATSLTAMVVHAPNVQANSLRNPWYFSAEEIGAAYHYQENYGARIRNPLPAQSCMFGKSDFVGTYRQAKIQFPCQFINEVTRHLKEMLALGAARYLFPLDADHAHLAVPAEIWAKKYSKLDSSQVTAALLREPSLVALYHTAEHLDPVETNSGESEGSVRAWKKKRNVLGFFDGRPVQVLTPHPEGFGVGAPDGYFTYGSFNFLANHRAELMLFHADKAIPFDLSLESGEEAEANALGRSLIRTVPR